MKVNNANLASASSDYVIYHAIRKKFIEIGRRHSMTVDEVETQALTPSTAVQTIIHEVMRAYGRVAVELGLSTEVVQQVAQRFSYPMRESMRCLFNHLECGLSTRQAEVKEGWDARWTTEVLLCLAQAGWISLDRNDERLARNGHQDVPVNGQPIKLSELDAESEPVIIESVGGRSRSGSALDLEEALRNFNRPADDQEEWLSARAAIQRSGLSISELEKFARRKLIALEYGRFKFPGEAKIVHRRCRASEMDFIRSVRQTRKDVE